MSGLQGIANWALGGLSGGNDDNDGEAQPAAPTEALSPEEMRRRRLARMTEPSTTATTTTANDPRKDGAEMDVDEGLVRDDSNEMESDVRMEVDVKKKEVEEVEASSANAADTTPAVVPLLKKEAVSVKKRPAATVVSASNKSMSTPSGVSKASPAPKTVNSTKSVNRLELKKLSYLQSLLQVTFSASTTNTANLEHTIGEALASRLASPLRHAKDGISYLSGCFKRASQRTSDEWRIKLAAEVRTQVVRYAASGLQHEDLFPCMVGAPAQLGKLCVQSEGDATPFYASLCTELEEQGALSEVVIAVVRSLKKELSELHTATGNGASLIHALAMLAGNKKAAAAIAASPDFLLPRPNTPEASVRIEPRRTPQQEQMYRMMQMLGGANAIPNGHLKRSGPAMEHDTVLGLCFRLGQAADRSEVEDQFKNPGRRTKNDVDTTIRTLRTQLQSHRDAMHRLVRVLLTAGSKPRTAVLTWISDCLLLNANATATMPDRSVVCSRQTLLNVSYVMLKLCGPFVTNEKKRKLIDPSFVYHETAHNGVYDSEVTRLGNSEAPADLGMYEPQNTFIPTCFFYAARALHLGLFPTIQRYSDHLRRVSHQGWMLSQQNVSWRDDPRYNRGLALQFAQEVTACDQTLLEESLAYYECMSKFLIDLGLNGVGYMPEFFVNDVCECLKFVSKNEPTSLVSVFC